MINKFNWQIFVKLFKYPKYARRLISYWVELREGVIVAQLDDAMIAGSESIDYVKRP